MAYYTIPWKSGGTECCTECQPDPSTCSCDGCGTAEQVTDKYTGKTLTFTYASWEVVRPTGGGCYTNASKIVFSGTFSSASEAGGCVTATFSGSSDSYNNVYGSGCPDCTFADPDFGTASTGSVSYDYRCCAGDVMNPQVADPVYQIIGLPSAWQCSVAPTAYCATTCSYSSTWGDYIKSYYPTIAYVHSDTAITSQLDYCRTNYSNSGCTNQLYHIYSQRQTISASIA